MSARLAAPRAYLASRPEKPCPCAKCVLERETERVKAVLANYQAEATAKVTTIKSKQRRKA